MGVRRGVSGASAAFTRPPLPGPEDGAPAQADRGWEKIEKGDGSSRAEGLLDDSGTLAVVTRKRAIDGSREDRLLFRKLP